MDWKEASIELSKKLNPKHVKPAPQGKFGDYVEGWHVIAEANRIFGFDGWSYTTEFQKVSEGTNAKGNAVVGYMCKCVVTVDGVVRGDVGFGSGAAKDLGDATEGAIKEAATDALKRCLRTFGNPFGLALYDKAKANVGVEPSTTMASATQQAREDAVMDSLPKDATPRQTGEAFTKAIIADLRKTKSEAGIEGAWKKWETEIGKLQDRYSDLYNEVFEAYEEVTSPFKSDDTEEETLNQ